MCFEVSALSQSDASSSNPNAESTSTSSVALEASASKTSNNPAELGALNQCLQELLDGIQVDLISFPHILHNLDYKCR